MVRLKSCFVDFLLYPHYETLPFQRWQRKKKNQNNQGIPQPSLERDSENVSSTFDLIDEKRWGKLVTWESLTLLHIFQDFFEENNYSN